MRVLHIVGSLSPEWVGLTTALARPCVGCRDHSDKPGQRRAIPAVWNGAENIPTRTTWSVGIRAIWDRQLGKGSTERIWFIAIVFGFTPTSLPHGSRDKRASFISYHLRHVRPLGPESQQIQKARLCQTGRMEKHPLADHYPCRER